jgi:ABC-type multidrug transport system ATPase subunit/ABC-type multidrug transport system permease subunit
LASTLNTFPQGVWVPNFVASIGLFLVLTIATAITMEFKSSSKSDTLTKLYLPGKAPKPRSKEEEEERTKKQGMITDQMNGTSSGTTFSWQDINYVVPAKQGDLHLLNGISGIVKPGHLTALMGSSGAGKTTLLDVLARRKTMGKVDGRFYLNGEALINDFERITGYCEQMDIHHPIATVREALRFSAKLRQPMEVSLEEKYAYVEQIIQLLEMDDIADAQVGDIETGFGISIEERKRLTIGVELVGKPQILFLDEPTSGLDAQSSFNIIRFIRKLADAGWPVLCTIHQPSAILFEHFDHLLLLVRGGRTAYYGEIGKDASTMIDYFESNGGPICSPEANPAEYLLEVVNAGTSGKVKQDWADIWDNSTEAKELGQELESIHQSADQTPQRKALTYSTPFLTQLYHVHNRLALGYWRSPDYNFGRFVTIMAISLISGFSFWKLSDSITDAKNRMFAMFLCFVIAYFVIFLAQPKFMEERVYFRREYASRYYGWIPFTLSIILVEVPYVLFFSASLLVGFYWTAGLWNDSETVVYFYLMVLFFIFWAVTLGFLLAAVTENPTLASILNPLLNSPFVLVAGLMQTVDAMPRFWSSWFYWLSKFYIYIYIKV